MDYVLASQLPQGPLVWAKPLLGAVGLYSLQLRFDSGHPVWREFVDVGSKFIWLRTSVGQVGFEVHCLDSCKRRCWLQFPSARSLVFLRCGFILNEIAGQLCALETGIVNTMRLERLCLVSIMEWPGSPESAERFRSCFPGPYSASPEVRWSVHAGDGAPGPEADGETASPLMEWRLDLKRGASERRRGEVFFPELPDLAANYCFRFWLEFFLHLGSENLLPIPRPRHSPRSIHSRSCPLWLRIASDPELAEAWHRFISGSPSQVRYP